MIVRAKRAHMSLFFFSSRRRHTRCGRDWSSDVCSSDLETMHSRPIINTRDEPHADPEKYRRLHVIPGDANMSEITTYLKMGTTAIVLSMVEDDFIDRDLSVDQPVQAFRKVSRDLACRD